MTTLLTTHDITRIVAAHGLPQVLRRLEEAITADFRRWADFDKVARVASHSKAGVIELMPVADAQQYSFKYVNGHPGNGLQGLPTVMAFGVLADVATGLPTLLSELTITTAMRTAATSVMAARLLARPASRTMALIGNGAQSEFQALAFHHLLGVKRLQLFDTDRSATAKLMRHLQGVPGLEVQVCANTADALRGADIVTTVTADKCNAVIVSADMLAPGMHLNAVGGDCPGKTELEAAVLRAAQVFVEYEPQTRVEGELQQMPADFEVTELWRVLHGQAAGRRDDAAITLFDSVGFALEDFSALRLMAELAQGLGLGRPLDLIPELSDPRDLFSLLAPLAQQRRAA
ncbi:MAG: ornithine cyclodeaminase [Rubrivivax sp.]|nr:ornithine cyclodeaminase [Rubrivivax sp.]